MKKVILVLVVLIALSSMAQAANLQTGWYTRFEYVSLIYNFYIPGGGWAAWGTDWHPASTLGAFGPVSVDIGYANFTDGRTVSIMQPTTTSGVLFEDTGIYSTSIAEFNQITFAWTTDYDASQMQLMAFVQHDGTSDKLIWSQTESGPCSGSASIRTYQNSIMVNGDRLVFRVVAVPEPTGLILLSTLLSGIAAGCVARRRR
jgi:opacity protein-like surface antigen